MAVSSNRIAWSSSLDLAVSYDTEERRGEERRGEKRRGEERREEKREEMREEKRR